MFALFDQSLSPVACFHALFSQPLEVGMRRTDADGQRPLFAEDFIPRPRDRRGDETALVNFIDIYCERLKNRSRNQVYVENVRTVLDRFVEYRGLHAARLRDVQSIDVEMYLAQRKKDLFRGKPLSAVTLNNEIGYLNTAFSFAGPKDKYRGGRKHLGWLAEPPYCERVPEPDLAPVELTDAQIQRFMEATSHATAPRIEGCSPRDFWVAVLILDSLTLLRRGALLSVLRPDDETLLVRKQLFVTADQNKTNEDIFVTLGTDDTIPTLFAKLPTKPGEPLLPWRRPDGRPMSLGYFSQHLKDFQRTAGVPEEERLKIKHLRSTGSNKAEELADEATAKSKLKHSPNTNTYRKHYKSRRPSQKEIQATDALWGWISGVIRTVADDEQRPPSLQVIG